MNTISSTIIIKWKELEFMELEICGFEVLKEMRKCLAIFLSELKDDVSDTDSLVSGGKNFARSQSMPLPEDDAEARAFQLGKSLLVLARLCLMFISYVHISCPLCSYLYIS